MSSNSCVIGWDPIRVTAIEWRPWVRVFGKGENFTIDGVLKDLLDSISSSMNFSYVLVDPRGTKFCPKGLYCINEMLHMLANKSAEIALFNYQVRLDRDGFANFPGTMYIDHGTLLLGNSRPGMSVHFEKIFHWKVWTLIAVFLILITGTYHVICKLLRPDQRHETFLRSLWNLMSPLLNQGAEIHESTRSARLVLALWFLATLVFICCMNGLIISTVAVERTHFSLADLLKNSDLEPLVPRYSLIEEHFWYTQDPDLMTLAQRMRQLPDSYVDNDDIHTDEVLERVEFGNKVLFTFYSEILNAMSERYARKKTCSFVISKNRYFPMVFSFALAKHLPKCFYDKVKFRTEAAFNNLLIDRWLQYHTRNYSKCLGSPSNEKSPLSLKDLESVFIWWIAGISAAFFVICFEFGWTKIEKLHYAVMSSN